MHGIGSKVWDKVTEEIWVLRPNSLDREARGFKGPTHRHPKTEALKLILDGTACFAEKPQEPPFELIYILRDRLEPGTLKLGPCLDDPELVSRVAKELFPDGRQQSQVDGRTVIWAVGRVGLRWLVGDALSNCGKKPSNLFAEARWLAAGEGVWPIAGSQDLAHDDGRREYSRTFPLTEWDELLSARTEAWGNFTAAVRTELHRFEKIIRAVLDEGRLIVGKNSKNGFSLMAPEYARRFQIDDFGSQYHFALSQDLPKEWWTGRESLAKRRKQARAWIEKAARHFEQQGRRFPMNDAAVVVQQRFSLTNYAAVGVVRAADLPGRGKLGNIQSRQKVSLEELLAFE